MTGNRVDSGWRLRGPKGEIELSRGPVLDGNSIRLETTCQFAYPIPGITTNRLGFDVSLWPRWRDEFGYAIIGPDGKEWLP